MKMHTASMSAQTMTTGIQILFMTLANPLLFDEREGNEPLPFLKLDGSKSPFWKLEGSKLPSPGVKEPEGFFESESESESDDPPGKLPEPPPWKSDDWLNPDGMLPLPRLEDPDGSANLKMTVAIMRSVKTISTIL